MTNQEAVKMIDETAKVCIWGNERDGQGYWIKGSGWETKITWSEEKAWQLAIEEIVSKSVIA